MNELSKREVHLVSLGAAIGCNCIPCTAYHLKECRSNGVTDEELAEVIQLCDLSPSAVKVRLHRGKEILRNSLNKACDFYYDSDSNLRCSE